VLLVLGGGCHFFFKKLGEHLLWVSGWEGRGGDLDLMIKKLCTHNINMNIVTQAFFPKWGNSKVFTSIDTRNLFIY
jgi:hypothetical protein